MLEITNIGGVGYYVKVASETEGIGKLGTTAHHEKQLYFDRDVAGLRGRWIRLQDVKILRGKNKFPDSIDNDFVEASVLHAMAEGRIPGEKRRLSYNARKRRAGYDLTFSVPKDVSTCFVYASPAMQSAIIKAQQNAVRKALEFAFSMGLFETRSRHNGSVRNSASDVPVALFTHFVSRAGDPQIHCHAVIPNMVVDGGNGHVRALDPKKLFEWKAAIAAAYRSELSAELRKKLGIETTRDQRNFTITGMPKEIKVLFSKRREEIVEELGQSQPTATNRTAARNAALRTRSEKGPPEFLSELVTRWRDEAVAAGFDPNDIARDISIAGTAALTLNGSENSRARQITAAQKELDDVMEKTSMITPALFHRHVLEAAQTLGSIAEIRQIIPILESRFVAMKDKAGIVTQLVSKADIRIEHEMWQAEKSGRGQWAAGKTALEHFVDRTRNLSDEQWAAVKHALNRDCVSIVEGAAGSGKSYSMGAFTDICRDSGHNVWVCAPSNKARDIIAADTRTPPKSAFSLQKLAAMIRGGKTIATTDVIIVDEAGMASLRDLATIIVAASKARAKVVLTGDTHQLLPVGAGAPMLGLQKDVGSARIFTIRRQTEKWMRDASMMFAERNAADALEAYETRGNLAFQRSSQATITAASIDALQQMRFDKVNDRHVLPTIIAPRRTDVRELNSAVRRGLKEKGLLYDSVSVEVYPLGEKEAVLIEIASGERIVFGENLNLVGEEVSNGEAGTVLSVWNRPRQRPNIRIELDREAEDKSPIYVDLDLQAFSDAASGRLGSIPLLQHAYAVTTHGSQGLTTDNVIVVNTAPMAADQLYVAMTRHRKTVKLHVAANRLLGQKTASPSATRQGALALSDAERAQAFRCLKTESMRPAEKLNPSDLLLHRARWLEADDPVAEFIRQQQPATPTSRLKDQITERSRNPGASRIDPGRLSQFSKAELLRIDQAVQAGVDVGVAPPASGNFEQLPTIDKAAIRTKLDLWKLNPIAKAYQVRIERKAKMMLNAARTITRSLQATAADVRKGSAGASQTKASLTVLAANLMKAVGVSQPSSANATVHSLLPIEPTASAARQFPSAKPEAVACRGLQARPATIPPIILLSSSNDRTRRVPDAASERSLGQGAILGRKTQILASKPSDRPRKQEINRIRSGPNLVAIWIMLREIRRRRQRLRQIQHQRELDRQNKLKQQQRGGWGR